MIQPGEIVMRMNGPEFFRIYKSIGKTVWNYRIEPISAAAPGTPGIHAESDVGSAVITITCISQDLI